MDPFIGLLFNKRKPFTPISIPGGSSNGYLNVTNKPTFGPRLQASEKESLEDDVDITRQKLRRNLELAGKIAEESEKTSDDIYERYKFDQRSQSSMQLPIYASKHEFLASIATCPAVVIEGSTGCGKSTQIPQIILDDARENKKPCNIIVTQPRRIAARSIAERVAAERGWDLGSVVGYQIGLDKKHMSEDTRLLFCTTGVLLERLIASKTLTHFTHIVLDEVHERDKDMDFLFIIIRMLLAKDAPNVKIILMSATIDSNMFAHYFEFYRDGHWQPAPIVRVDQKNQFKVRTFFLDDLDRSPEISWQPGISDEMYKVAFYLIKRMKTICKETDDNLSSILVFLPGIYEIGRMRNILYEYTQSKADVAWKIFILHSMISTEEQQSIFQPVEDGVRKIILSTNIAESSITVPDVQIVIDFCLLKYLKSDTTKNFTSLEMAWASKNNCRQRAGRAGRVANGRCYRLVHHRFFHNSMTESAVPELLLTPLENVILKAKTFDMGAPHVILGLAMDDSIPKMDDVANTVLSLKELGALQLTHQDEGYSPIDGDLTFLGRVMSNLPVDVRATRLIAIGSCFGVLEECIIMAAGLTTKSIFKIGFDHDLSEYTRRLEWSNGSGSDLFAILNAYKTWTLKYNQKVFGKTKEQQKAEKEFCLRHYLDVRSLHECHHLVQELTQRLERLGIYELAGNDRLRWTEQEKCIILKMVIAGAFYPNFFATAPISNPMIERDVYRSLNGRDPHNTVYFTNFRQENIRELYADTIRNLFVGPIVKKEDINDVKISFDNSEKVFVTFDHSQSINADTRQDWDTKHCSIPGKTLTDVYKAVKMRKMNMPTRIAVMKPEKERELAENLGLGIMTGSTFTLKKHLRDEIGTICIPNASKKRVTGAITHIESCSKFWFRPNSELQRIEHFNRELNERSNQNIEACSDFFGITHDQIIVARDYDDNMLHRARFITWDYDAFTNEFKQATVCFIDYGHTQKCDTKDLYVFTRATEMATMPPRCFQCRLAEIQPSTINLSGGYMWDHRAIQQFKQLLLECEVKAEIYSVVNGVVNVFIWKNNSNFNEYLIKEGLGEFCEENFLSKDNHWKRQCLQDDLATNPIDETNLDLEDCDEYYPMVTAEPIKVVEDRNYGKVVQLKGPISPLETQVHSVLMDSDQKSISIDAHSVNSVFLTTLQQDLSIKYIVAAHISQQGFLGNKGFTIHETTQLPSIRGFGALMAIIFCPSLDLKRDKWKSRYISARTGLGFNDEKGCPYFAEHDTVIPLDFELDESDLAQINQIRYSIDMLLFSFNTTGRNETLAPQNRLEVMKKLKELTIKLLTKNRKAIEINPVQHEWKEYNADEFTKPDNVYGAKAIFPMHGLLRLNPIDDRTKKKLKKYCEELHKMTVSMPRPVTCQLCATEIENVTMLRTHLMTRLHLQREQQLEI
ncbi:probable ATP-dependent RNA helicase spindle-E [Sitodiplosis mosellana]|uniref:probable ATP-dependent RNA helicase spindle-E n=1 Tax=Sitodiplosis mosellana TaxID=263140 RepID=UPI002443D2D4|nr:probable ATP-dependent RNA helicase spindle-E [Sitodiplosis mosellana]